MPLIKKQKTEVLKRFTVRLEAGLLDQLSAYAEYLESSKDHVIAEAVKYIIDRDKDFAQNVPQSSHQISHQNSHQISHQNVGKSEHLNGTAK